MTYFKNQKLVRKQLWNKLVQSSYKLTLLQVFCFKEHQNSKRRFPINPTNVTTRVYSFVHCDDVKTFLNRYYPAFERFSTCVLLES